MKKENDSLEKIFGPTNTYCYVGNNGEILTEDAEKLFEEKTDGYNYSTLTQFVNHRLLRDTAAEVHIKSANGNDVVMETEVRMGK